jgi:hypothetical protein
MRHCPPIPVPFASFRAPDACVTGEIRLQDGEASGDCLPLNPAQLMTEEGFEPGDAFRERVNAGANPH